MLAQSPATSFLRQTSPGTSARPHLERGSTEDHQIQPGVLQADPFDENQNEPHNHAGCTLPKKEATFPFLWVSLFFECFWEGEPSSLDEGILS
jgi:hypothetical protein